MRPLLMLLCLIAGSMTGPAMAQESSLPTGAETESEPESESELITSWGPRVEGETFEYTTGGQTYQGYLARNVNDTKPRPAVLVVHEWWGLDGYARARADQLAALGFVALAVDMYGGGQVATHPDQAGEFSSQVMQDWPAARARFEAAMSQLRQHPAVADTGMAALGYCFGGSVVMNMALSGMPLEAVISFHGGPTQAASARGEFNGAVQIHNGGADSLVERNDLSAMARALEAQGADIDVINYPQALHGFTNPGADALAKEFDLPLGYNAAADAASWQSALLLLDKTLNQ
ncbi:dienelactone hydrolase family protein [Halomonas sp. MCCC 1A17488]|uniref:dienelactone hydrolase family protein n=1 Tax=unclassified Halomonas TaxID=2609666 RepID=UPI0018D26478|nr:MULTISPECIES: dienelactone hydrolase family protein [unclassified Halomonas]MCE8017119.1 dienelactone hydrolase family protein [Halomonas sp. MCCC 1A17488]MCG3240452.1 dienelactone hydrolase family protein [Halomonas sp. MCCC 1A17488]QPP49687.1 dienelactone hydrolase family protein [Halomonas sp. SS10-MC5]